MKSNEAKKQSVSNVVVIADVSERLNLEVGNVYEFGGKKLSITSKRSHTEENPTTGKKTLWSGEIDGEIFAEVDVCKLRKLFGLAERKREKSAGKTFEFEGNVYSLDDSADKMIEGAVIRYESLLSQLRQFEKQYGFMQESQEESDSELVSAVRSHITAKVEAVCLARKVAAEEAKKAEEAAKIAKQQANKEYRAKVKEAKCEFFALLSAGVAFADVTTKIAEKYGLQVSDLA